MHAWSVPLHACILPPTLHACTGCYFATSSPKHGERRINGDSRSATSDVNTNTRAKHTDVLSVFLSVCTTRGSRLCRDDQRNRRSKRRRTVNEAPKTSLSFCLPCFHRRLALSSSLFPSQGPRNSPASTLLFPTPHRDLASRWTAYTTCTRAERDPCRRGIEAEANHLHDTWKTTDCSFFFFSERETPESRTSTRKYQTELDPYVNAGRCTYGHG